ncbi:MAG: DUF4340 domain-containing protein [Clostridia bacterium]|nr:DUF4340 domain-containing protein [Clostridia bacterium]
MTKKAIIACVIVALVLAAFISAYLFMTSNSGKEEDASSSVVLNDRDKDEMISLSFEKGDISLSFLKDANDIWNFADAPTTSIYYAYVNNMASAVTSFEPKQEITGGNEDDYGFSSPSLTVTCEYKNGIVYTLTFGDENEAVGGVYVKEAGSGKIYLADSSILSAFNETRETLTVPDEESEE